MGFALIRGSHRSIPGITTASGTQKRGVANIQTVERAATTWPMSRKKTCSVLSRSTRPKVKTACSRRITGIHNSSGPGAAHTGVTRQTTMNTPIAKLRVTSPTSATFNGRISEGNASFLIRFPFSTIALVPRINASAIADHAMIPTNM